MDHLSDLATDQHLAWMARSFGRPDYLPLTRDDLQALAGCAELVKRFRGSHLFRQGEPAVAAYLIKEGQVDIYRGGSDTPQVVARVGPGSVIGDIAMFGDGVYESSVRAIVHTRAFRFERSSLLPELAKHPSNLPALAGVRPQSTGTSSAADHPSDEKERAGAGGRCSHRGDLRWL